MIDGQEAESVSGARFASVDPWLRKPYAEVALGGPEDADLDGAVTWSIRAVFSNAGQVCLAGSRLYVQRDVYTEFTDRFVAAAQALVAGDPKNEATQLGPLASQEHYKKVRSGA